MRTVVVDGYPIEFVWYYSHIEMVIWNFVAELSAKGSWTALDYLNKFNKIWEFDDNCERISENEVNCAQFIERYERHYKPVVIEDTQVSRMEFSNPRRQAEDCML